MAAIPVYLKTTPDMPRPADPEYYLVTRSGTFLCRNHAFFSSDVRTTRGPSALEFHAEKCSIRYPKLSQAALEFAVGFFDQVYDLHGSEAVILLFWDLKRQRYKLWVPQQEPTVWETSGGHRTALDVAYQVPVPLPQAHLLVGDIHSHADLDAYASHQDRHDEFYRDGVHVVVGRIDEEPPQFHLDIAVDGQRFLLKFGQFLRGYHRRRQLVPQAWMDKVQVKVKRSWWVSSTTPYTWQTQDDRFDHQNYNNGYGSGSRNAKLLPDESSPINQPNNRKKDWFNC
jgi:hypothetical protein